VWIEMMMYVQEAVAPATAPAGTTTAAPPPGGGFQTMLPFILVMFAVMYFMMIRPNQRRERERRQMLDSIAKNDLIVTTGGIMGTVIGVNDKTVVLKVSDDPVTKIEFVRSAVAQVTKAGKDEASKN
jgi:preprotein translocase subunit YajC